MSGYPVLFYSNIRCFFYQFDGTIVMIVHAVFTNSFCEEETKKQGLTPLLFCLVNYRPTFRYSFTI
ncbi:hypothetical protein DTQ70_12810 [Runella sp. SP2]|nr:hypothetical protein DTQ70_12810 [Runella sp. SP2]